MAKYLTIEVGGATGVARLLEEKAPIACAKLSERSGGTVRIRIRR